MDLELVKKLYPSRANTLNIAEMRHLLTRLEKLQYVLQRRSMWLEKQTDMLGWSKISTTYQYDMITALDNVDNLLFILKNYKKI